MRKKAEFYAAFDTRYSWLLVLWDAFESMSPWLQDSSVLEIWPDNDYCKLTVMNGNVHYEGEGFWFV